MKKLNNYIIEKLKLSRNNKIQEFTELDTKNIDMMLDILKASFIGLWVQHFKSHPDIFRKISYSLKSIYRKQVDYDNIYNILNDYYQYNYDLENNEVKKSLHNIVHYYLVFLDQLINMKTVNIPCVGGEVKGYQLYWNEWRKYSEKYDIS